MLNKITIQQSHQQSHPHKLSILFPASFLCGAIGSELLYFTTQNSNWSEISLFALGAATCSCLVRLFTETT